MITKYLKKIHNDEEVNTMQKVPDGTDFLSRAESCAYVLRGLISYHERMTMGQNVERDFYLDALRYALECVEKSRQ